MNFSVLSPKGKWVGDLFLVGSYMKDKDLYYFYDEDGALIGCISDKYEFPFLDKLERRSKF